jgi:two-component system, NarL family, response regulator DevR
MPVRMLMQRTERDERAPTRVFVVDDHEMVRRGLRDLAEECGGIEVVGEADRASTTLEGIAAAHPQVALLDIRLPDGDGVELCREIRSAYPDVRCLMFTSYADDEALVNAILAGASGYLLKLTTGEELIEAIRSVATGTSRLDPETARSAMGKAAGAPRAEAKLSPQQDRVLELIVDGLSNREIAARLGLAEKTVKNYVSAILEKLDLRSRTQAALYRAQHPPED